MAEYYRNGWYTPLTKKIDKNAKDIKDLDTDVDTLTDKVNALEDEVPDPPEVNGSYNLNAIVSSEETLVGWSPDRLPVVAQADAGKFLVVNSSGEWAATTVPAAETSSF